MKHFVFWCSIFEKAPMVLELGKLYDIGIYFAALAEARGEYHTESSILDYHELFLLHHIVFCSSSETVVLIPCLRRPISRQISPELVILRADKGRAFGAGWIHH
ncbi:hypothetical protein V2G26_017027 [Clonostachys chloroleuca]